MSDLPGLRKRRGQRAFARWGEYLPAERVAQSDDAVRQLIDRLLALGPEPTQDQVRVEIDECVRRFNDLDASGERPWIFTIERENIAGVLWGLIDLCGFAGDEDWLAERDWRGGAAEPGAAPMRAGRRGLQAGG